MRRSVFCFLILSVSFLFSSPSFSAQTRLPTSLALPAELPRSIKVALVVDVASVPISTEGTYALHVSTGSRAEFTSKRLEATVRTYPEGIKINNDLYPTDRVTITVSAGFIQVGKRKYANQIQIIKKSNDKLLVVNQIDLEEYLKGVLPLEVHPQWPLESLKAHAVVSRTFALFKILEKKGQDYAVASTVQSQVYGGSLFHKESTDRAVELTRGEVLTSGGALFPSYFHAACGGQTAQADQLWAVEPNPALKGVICHFCKGTRHWRWSLKMPLKQIEKVMQQNGYPAKNLLEIQFAGWEKTGRATRVILKYKLSQLVIRAEDFRAWIGNDALKSLKASVSVKNGLAYFVGYGWGHGIGFCQWGSKTQSDGGKNYAEILNFYFPGSKIVVIARQQSK